MKHAVSFEKVRHYMAPYESFFSRSEARDLAARYVWGLVLGSHRKSAGAMAEVIGVPERSLQRLLTQATWDYDGLYNAYLQHMVNLHGDAGGVLVAGQRVFPKRGGHSVCVARQYSEELGRMVSCQVAAEIVFVGRNGSWPMAMELYMPVFWDKRRDQECRLRRKKARIPEDVHHAEQWELVLDMVSDAAGVLRSPHPLTAGMAFGDASGFRDALDRTGQNYLVEVPSHTEVFLERPELKEVEKRRRRRGRPRKHSCMMDADIPPVRVKDVTNSHEKACVILPDEEEGSCLVRLGKVWPAQGYRNGIIHEPAHLVSRYKGSSEGVPAQGYYLSNMSEESTGANDMARILGSWNKALECREDMVRKLGLLHHEGRSWIGWHRHVLLVFLAWGFLLGNRI